jgi:hypothetical protein
MRSTKDTSTPTLAIDGVHELTESDLDAVSGGFGSVEHGTLPGQISCTIVLSDSNEDDPVKVQVRGLIVFFR